VSLSNGAPYLPVLYPILDADLVFRSQRHENRWDLLRGLLRELADAGVEMLQYRNKREEDVVVIQDALAMREAAPSLRLILNDRAELVLPAGWNGVHVGQDDMPPAAARALVGRRTIVGLSTHNDEQVMAADAQPVDYIAVGPVFATATKSDTSPVIGVEGVMRARSLTTKPLVAIGGISHENAPSVYDAGADSIAVISAIFASGRSPAQSVKDFLQIFK
jgi:thiamine-phosphate pyrophosphorylase